EYINSEKELYTLLNDDNILTAAQCGAVADRDPDQDAFEAAAEIDNSKIAGTKQKRNILCNTIAIMDLDSNHNCSVAIRRKVRELRDIQRKNNTEDVGYLVY